jgi:hypothetical protein
MDGEDVSRSGAVAQREINQRLLESVRVAYPLHIRASMFNLYPALEVLKAV